MSTFTSIIQDEALSTTLQKGFYALAACTIIGTAAYVGYRAADSDQAHIRPPHRRPESNEQVKQKQCSSSTNRINLFN